MTRSQAFSLVDRAREEAELKRGQGWLPYTSAEPECPTHMWLAALAEELGEVARCVHDDDEEGLREELAQLAGVAVGRLEAMA